VDNIFYIYGGNVSPENLILDEMWALDLNRVPWDSKQPELPGALWEKVIYKSEDGNLPGRLKGHTCVAHPDGIHLILFGGQGPDLTSKNHLFFFNTQTRSWRKMQTKGVSPPGRCMH
jgi:hypothetical protein